MASNWLSYQDCYNFIFHGKMVTQQSQSIFFVVVVVVYIHFTSLFINACLFLNIYIYIYIFFSHFLVYCMTELRVLISYIVRCDREENVTVFIYLK